MSRHWLAIYENGKIAPFIISTEDWDTFMWRSGFGPQWATGLSDKLESGEWSIFRNFGEMSFDDAYDVIEKREYEIIRDFETSAYTENELKQRNIEVPFDSVRDLYGFASPDGVYYVCGDDGHSAMASIIAAKELQFRQYRDLMDEVPVEQDAPLRLNYVCISGDGLILINPKNNDYCLTPQQVEVLHVVANIASGIGTEFSQRFSDNLRRRIELYQIGVKRDGRI